MAAFHWARAAFRGALHPKTIMLAPSTGKGGYAATPIDLKDVAMFEEDSEAERRENGANMRDLGAAPDLPCGEGRCRG